MLQDSFDAKELALQALCGALLQVAKQGISVKHAGPNQQGIPIDCPIGREVDGIPMKDIVWSGRNQALHYEDTNIKPETKKLFKLLEDKFGSEFALSEHMGKSRAKQVVMKLGWINYPAYCSDMKILGLE